MKIFILLVLVIVCFMNTVIAKDKQDVSAGFSLTGKTLEEVQWQEYKLHDNYIEFYKKNPKSTAEESSFVRISEILEVRYHIEGSLTHIYIFTTNTNHTLHKGESDFKKITEHFKNVK